MNSWMGAFARNENKILEKLDEASEASVDLALFPEFSICAYPPEDLIFRHDFREACEQSLDNIVKKMPKTLYALVSYPRKSGQNYYNSAALISRGQIHAYYDKIALPNYGVFDEKRIFSAGEKSLIIDLGSYRLGLQVCEDSWEKHSAAFTNYQGQRLDAMLNLSASPFHKTKNEQRQKVLSTLYKQFKCPVFYVNCVAGQDELIFDGRSKIYDPKSNIDLEAKFLAEDTLFFDLENKKEGSQLSPVDQSRLKTISLEVLSEQTKAPLKAFAAKQSIDESETLYKAAVYAIAEYFEKNKQTKAVVAVSGGIDSALVCAMTVEALGPENVQAFTMPSQYNSKETLADSHLLAKNLGIVIKEISIQDMYLNTKALMTSALGTDLKDLTMQNIQARSRALLLMAFANQSQALVMNTGNKSEIATGYCTLYGDMVGAFAPLKDLLKTQVYELARHLNKNKEIIPWSIINREPTAELKDEQKDQDTLPEYSHLDRFIMAYVENDLCIEEIMKLGFEREEVKTLIALIERAEFKRRQAPPGPKLSKRAFGRDRRYPLSLSLS